MKLLKREGVSHLQNWKTFRTHLVSRMQLGADEVRCEVSGLAFGKVEGRYVLPAVNFAAGQSIYLEIRKPGKILEIDGATLSLEKQPNSSNFTLFRQNTPTSGKTNLYQFSSNTFPVIVVRSNTVYAYHGAYPINTQFQQQNGSSFSYTEGPVTVFDNAKAIEVSYGIPINVSYNRMPIPPVKTSYYSQFEKRNLAYSSGYNPKVGNFPGVEVLTTSGAMLSAKVTLTGELQTIRFAHIVGLSNIDFNTTSQEQSIEHLTILADGGFALVFLRNALVGKFQYEFGDPIDLENVFSLRIYTTDITMSPGIDMYVCGEDSADVDVTQFAYESFGDRVSGNLTSSDSSAFGLGSSSPYVNTYPIEVEKIAHLPSFGLSLTRMNAPGTSFGLRLQWQTDNHSYQVRVISSQVQVYVPSVGTQTQYLEIPRSETNIDIVIAGDKLAVVVNDIVLEFNLPETQDTAKGMYLERYNYTSTITFTTIGVYASNFPFIGVNLVTFADGAYGAGDVADRGNPYPVYGSTSFNLPEDEMQPLQDRDIITSVLHSKIRSYMLEANDVDKPRTEENARLHSKIRSYYLDTNPTEMPYSEQQDVNSSNHSKVRSYFLEENEGDAPKPTTMSLLTVNYLVTATITTD